MSHAPTGRPSPVTHVPHRPLHPRDLPDTEQYSLAAVLGIWAASALPMGLALWWATPVLLRGVVEPLGVGYLVLATAGLLWQAVLAWLLLRRDVRPLTWAGLRRRLWLDAPMSPRTGRARWRYLAWAPVVAVAYLAIGELGILEPLNEAWISAVPAFAPPEWGLIENLGGHIEGQWWLLGLLIALILGNYVIGEELIFRGILLPRMRGVFGRWDVVANGVLFATYHVHVLWAVPAMLVTDWIYAWLTKRYRSYWMGALFHGLDALFLMVLFPLAILGRV